MKPENQEKSNYQWLIDERYQTVLRATHTIAFEYNPATGRQLVSPFINEYVAGNYDGRLLSNVMLEDGVIHPHDISLSLDFREKVKNGTAHEMTLRLLTPDHSYRWFTMCLCPFMEDGSLCYVGTLTDVDEEMRQKEELRYQAEYDSTTGIYNKQTFEARTQEWLTREPNVFRCLIRFDIDRFKLINELYSVSMGDQVLSHIGELLKELVRPPETYARFSSDIFCVCLARPIGECAEAINRIEQKLNEYTLDFQFALSAGIVCLPRYNGEPVNVICDRAAMAQRTIKGSYINNYAFYEESMNDALSKEHFLTKSMKKALENGQFLVYLQPKYDMQKGAVIGAEALVRWRHPEKGLIPPGEFIPLFEHNGFILRLDEYVWEETCRLLRRWIDEGRRPVPVSVNVSRVHLHDTRFCDKLLELIRKYDLPPHLLELEITESAYTDDPQILYGIMDKLQENGFLFSMDDFGSGYSSLNVLKDIPVNLVKIDLNFLQEARRGYSIGQNILKGTVQLIQGIDLPVIAEGVETKEQVDFLMDIGCKNAQGYYYAKPMPVSDFEDLLWPEGPEKEKESHSF